LSKDREVVLDIFLGSGTTLIACACAKVETADQV